MKNYRKFYFRHLFAFVFSLPAALTAQINYSDFITSGEHDSYFKVAVRERQPAPLLSYREADVKYYHKVIRCIDARQKMNKALEWPRQPLNLLLYTALWEGSITPYKNDSLSSFYSQIDFQKRGGRESVISLSRNPDDPTDIIDSVIWIPLEAEDIHKFWILEDWIFDFKHSVFKPRIIAIAPVFRPTYDLVTGSEQPLCWIPMDDKLRVILSGSELFNRQNQAARLSYDDFFQMRIFDSYVIWESNVHDMFISEFEEYENDPVGALLESERIKNDLFIFEHDLWQF